MKVFGVGGAGCNTINRMVKEGLEGVEFVAVNTDAQTLANSLAHTHINIGLNLTKGLGAGANPEIGRKAAEENLEDLQRVLEDTDMVFITGGMGGGTGTG
ncbi:cell division protein FtsZ, partial [Candidatus Woesebacteria bacterium]|nr:cell division protein FtsZ [Candidatus Woesebacteria bacterium]